MSTSTIEPAVESPVEKAAPAPQHILWLDVDGDHRVYLFTEQEAKWWAVATPAERERILQRKRDDNKYILNRSK